MAVKSERITSEAESRGEMGELLPNFVLVLLVDFQTKNGMKHLMAKQSATQLPWCLSLPLPSHFRLPTSQPHPSLLG